MRNSLAKAIKEQVMFPKFVLIIPDIDIISGFPKGTFLYGASGVEAVSRVIHWLMSEYDRLTKTQKEYLPVKAQKVGYPSFVWIEAPAHKNFADNALRDLFNLALVKAASLHENVAVLGFKKIWDPQNDTLYLKREGCFTADGLRYYWESIDKTFRYADTIYFKKMLQKKMKTIQHEAHVASDHHSNGTKKSISLPEKQSYDKYHWHSSNAIRKEKDYNYRYGREQDRHHRHRR